ncbi:class E sortase [Streptomyces sp. NPDC018693]|uniref:class E sortase n=1 Tax=unclassified Streptomyces TaxID=2593676 RepID=UPI00379114B0
MRLIVRTVSELCITVGTVIVLFVVYVMFWTGVRAEHVMDDQVERLEERWARQAAVRPAPAESTPPPQAYKKDEPFAIMYIPRLGFTWNKPVLEGTATDTLKKGLGHYANTARLGEAGNFSVAGHRRTHGDPFKDFPKLRRGDAVVLTDGTTWFTYRIDKGPYRTVPTDIEVIDPVPRKSGYTRQGRYLTLTTCDPEWGHSHRLIVWAHLDSTQPVDTGKPAALRR